MTNEHESPFFSPSLPEGERSWWRYLRRFWREVAKHDGVDWRMSKREAKLAAYRRRRKPTRVNHIALYRKLTREKRRTV